MPRSRPGSDPGTHADESSELRGGFDATVRFYACEWPLLRIAIRAKRSAEDMVGRVGIEPTTKALKEGRPTPRGSNQHLLHVAK